MPGTARPPRRSCCPACMRSRCCRVGAIPSGGRLRWTAIATAGCALRTALRQSERRGCPRRRSTRDTELPETALRQSERRGCPRRRSARRLTPRASGVRSVRRSGPRACLYGWSFVRNGHSEPPQRARRTIETSWRPSVSPWSSMRARLTKLTRPSEPVRRTLRGLPSPQSPQLPQ